MRYECGDSNKCQNCDKIWAEDQLREIEDLEQRVAPGDIVPSGECPECGAVCHPVEQPTLHAEEQPTLRAERFSPNDPLHFHLVNPVTGEHCASISVTHVNYTPAVEKFLRLDRAELETRWEPWVKD